MSYDAWISDDMRFDGVYDAPEPDAEEESLYAATPEAAEEDGERWELCGHCEIPFLPFDDEMLCHTCRCAFVWSEENCNAW
jgi:hypothetical protein